MSGFGGRSIIHASLSTAPVVSYISNAIKKTILLLVLVVLISNLLPAHARVRQESDLSGPNHVLNEPLMELKSLPEYSYGSQAIPRLSSLSKPDGRDLDVTYIERTPKYDRYDVWYTADGKPYLRPGTENEKRWPDEGELVTFTAHIMNKGTVATGNFDYRWYIDAVEVHSGSHGSLGPGEEASASFQWIWAHPSSGERLLGQHTIRFEVDPANLIAETYESNNSREDRTDALSLVLAVTPALYQALETPVDPQWPFSAEDWLQKQIAAMNEAFSSSNYDSAPNGVHERVRLDKILVTETAPPLELGVDGGFFMIGDDRYGNSYYDPDTDVSGGLLHELTHQLGIIDLYNLDVPLEILDIVDRFGRPIQMEYRAGLEPGLMSNPGIRPPKYEEHTVLALNAGKGYRRGYYGEYLYDVPEHSYLLLLDNNGTPAPGVTVKLYQRSSEPGPYGSKFGTIDRMPEVTGVSGSDGRLLLANRPVGEPVTTHTGRTLRDNPFGVINVTGLNDEFLVEVTKGNHQEFSWLDITAFNLIAWQGNDTITLATHVPPPNAPPIEVSLSGLQESGTVKLSWTTTAGAAGFNVYRATAPVFSFQRIATNTVSLNHEDPNFFSARAAVYAVTAVDAQGRESGFNNLFYALRQLNPWAVLNDGLDRRLVLDPQNGYALLSQTSAGQLVDTRSSVDYHLEHSRYMVRDGSGRLLVTHPGDYYTANHSIRVFDRDFVLAFEFGKTVTGPGQLQNPTGIGVWNQPCGVNSCRIIVADSGNHRITVWDENGIFLSSFGQLGDGNGQFHSPQGLAVRQDGRVYVVDSGNNRVQVFIFDGVEFSYRETFNAGFNQPHGIALYGQDYIVVADTGNNAVKLLDHAGNLLATFGGPTGDYIDTFNQPHGVVVDYFGNIVVADTGNLRVAAIQDALPAWQLYLPMTFASP